ncbi:MAG: hypothetical protein K0S44_320 [Bacteroidetes bacterium]|jgi:hypothetical protein|nr:hypothetical protein [Bacteroidota bacterium]
MKPTFQTMLLAFVLLFSSSLNAQQKKTTKDIKKIFFYSFENLTSTAQVQTLEQNVLFINGVTEVKSNYDLDKRKGQIIVVVIERAKISEGDPQFSLVSLKSAIVKSHLTPLEVIEEDTVIEN